MHKNKKFPCKKCYKEFITKKGLDVHYGHMHRYVPAPTPVPKKTIEVSKGIPYSGNYLGARDQLGIGDVFYRVEKHVVTSLTITEGSRDAQIGSIITQSNWQQNKPE